MRLTGRLSPRLRRRLLILFLQLLVITLLLGGCELLAGDPRRGTGVIDEFFTGKPSKTLRSLMQMTGSGSIFIAAWTTLQEAVIGFVIGSVIGITIGFWLGASRTLASVFAPMVYAADTIPGLALIPMFILWFGIGVESKIAMVAFIVFFYTFYNSYAGATQVDEELVDVTRMMGASRWQILYKVTLPSAIAWVSLGLQVSVVHAFTGAVVAEIITGNGGLGHLIARAAGQFDPNGTWAAIGAAVILATVLNTIVWFWSKRLLRWRTTSESSSGAIAMP